jgi:hypothetical protein
LLLVPGFPFLEFASSTIVSVLQGGEWPATGRWNVQSLTGGGDAFAICGAWRNECSALGIEGK